VTAALAEVMKGRTTFVIAHRLATVRNATRILMFDKGRIVESGSFDALVAKRGLFAKLAEAQFLRLRRRSAGNGIRAQAGKR
jgi:ATP-binding cassette subfamily B protein